MNPLEFHDELSKIVSLANPAHDDVVSRIAAMGHDEVDSNVVILTALTDPDPSTGQNRKIDADLGALGKFEITEKIGSGGKMTLEVTSTRFLEPLGPLVPASAETLDRVERENPGATRRNVFVESVPARPKKFEIQNMSLDTLQDGFRKTLMLLRAKQNLRL